MQAASPPPQRPPLWRRAVGFTLLELSLALAVFTILLGAIFGVVVSTTEFTGELAMSQETEIQRRAFLRLLRRAFSELPPSDDLVLEIDDLGGGRYDQTLVLPTSLPVLQFGDAPPDPEGHILLRADRVTGGYRVAKLVYRNSEEIEADLPGTELKLLPDIAEFSWRFYQRNTGGWMERWDEGMGRPWLAELTWSIGAGETARNVFSIPSLQASSSGLRSPAPGSDNAPAEGDENVVLPNPPNAQ